MVEDSRIPARGNLIWLSFSPQAGREQAGRRPAVVISPQAYNAKVGLLLCCPVTSRSKGYPFEVVLPDDLPFTGVVLSDQLKSVDWRARAAEIAGAVPVTFVREILARIETLLS